MMRLEDLSKEEFAFIDQALRTHGKMHPYADLSEGLSAQQQWGQVYLHREETGWRLEVLGEAAELSCRINEQGELLDLVTATVEPEPDLGEF